MQGLDVSSEDVAQIWCQLLATDALASDANLFAMGATSLNVLQFINAASDRFRRQLPIREVYTTPTAEELAAKLNALSVVESPLPPPVASPADWVVSPAQAHFYSDVERRSNLPFLFMAPSFRASGLLDCSILRQSLERVARNHEALRAYFVKVNNQLRRHVAVGPKVHLEQLELGDGNEEEKLLRAATFVRAQVHAGMNVSAAPLYRVFVSKIGVDDYLILFFVHHLMMDGYSVDVWLKEVADTYSDLVSGRPPALASGVRQESYYIAWHRSHFVEAEQRASFRRMLLGAPLVVPLAPASIHSDKVDMEGLMSVTIAEEVVRKLHQFATRRKVSLYAVLVAVWNVVLHHYCGVTDIVVRAAGSARDRIEFTEIVGQLWTALYIRCRFASHTSFDELIDRVREAILMAHEHQHLPTKDAVLALLPEVDLNATPPNFHFTLHERSGGSFRLKGMTIKPYLIGLTDHGADIKIHLGQGNGSIGGSIIYRTDIFSADFIERLFGDFVAVIEPLLERPSQRVGTVRLMSAN